MNAEVKQGLKVVVQPCTRRVFTDVEYEEAGAEIKEDLSECSTVLAVKEVPPELMLPGREAQKAPTPAPPTKEKNTARLMRA